MKKITGASLSNEWKNNVDIFLFYSTKCKQAKIINFHRSRICTDFILLNTRVFRACLYLCCEFLQVHCSLEMCQWFLQERVRLYHHLKIRIKSIPYQNRKHRCLVSLINKMLKRYMYMNNVFNPQKIEKFNSFAHLV